MCVQDPFWQIQSHLVAEFNIYNNIISSFKGSDQCNVYVNFSSMPVVHKPKSIIKSETNDLEIIYVSSATSRLGLQ